MLRDRLVCGISSNAIQHRLLQESALTFDKALELALAAEAAHKDSQRLLGANPLDKDLPTIKEGPELPLSQPPVHKVSESKPRQRRKGPSPLIKSRSECYRCGGKHHHSRCPCKLYECYNCEKKGHLAKM